MKWEKILAEQILKRTGLKNIFWSYIIQQSKLSNSFCQWAKTTNRSLKGHKNGSTHIEMITISNHQKNTSLNHDEMLLHMIRVLLAVQIYAILWICRFWNLIQCYGNQLQEMLQELHVCDSCVAWSVWGIHISEIRTCPWCLS